jgi:hypothetical protein
MEKDLFLIIQMRVERVGVGNRFLYKSKKAKKLK